MKSKTAQEEGGDQFKGAYDVYRKMDLALRSSVNESEIITSVASKRVLA